MNSFFQLLLISNLTLGLFAALSDYKITCKDESGKPVDWFSAYKLPRKSDSPNVNIQVGGGYVYLTEKFQNWTLSSQGFDKPTSIIGKTLESFYTSNFDDKGKLGFVLYNDQFEEQDLASRAHAKGVIYFDDKSAVWIVHSIPHYPPLPSSKLYSLKSSQMRYGQSMICLSLPLSELEKVGKQLLFAWPQVIDKFIPSSLQTNSFLQNLISVSNGNKYNSPKQGFAEDNPLGWANREEISTLDKNSFSTFYKHTKFASDLYSDFVATELKSELFSETWSNGVGGILTSECKKSYPVYNIKQLAFKAINVIFRVNSDHSKWAISNPKNANERAVCIGDVNRMASQFKRGGGTICMRNEPVAWNSFRQIIDETEPCPL